MILFQIVILLVFYLQSSNFFIKDVIVHLDLDIQLLLSKNTKFMHFYKEVKDHESYMFKPIKQYGLFYHELKMKICKITYVSILLLLFHLLSSKNTKFRHFYKEFKDHESFMFKPTKQYCLFDHE